MLAPQVSKADMMDSFPAANITGQVPDGNIASASTWNDKQDALTPAAVEILTGEKFTIAEQTRVSQVDLGKNLSTLDLGDVADSSSYKRLSADKKIILDGIDSFGSGTIISQLERTKLNTTNENI